MEILQSLGLSSLYPALFLACFVIMAIIKYSFYANRYRFTDDEKNLLNELLDNAFDEAEIFGDVELKQDIYILKQKIKR
jgi:hypothetical protein